METELVLDKIWEKLENILLFCSEEHFQNE